jgi:ribosomal protein S18 acetylase RimI-like enzyme
MSTEQEAVVADNAAFISLPGSEVDAAGRLVARACLEDPCFRHVFPDPDSRLRCAEAFFGWCLRHAHLYGEVTRPAGSLNAVAIVYRSAELERHPEREQLAASDYASMEQQLGVEAHQRVTSEFYDRIFAGASAALHARLDEGYWELDQLAVAPADQGRGIGSSLIRHVNHLADRGGKQVGLITFNPRNLPLYGRHGYEVVAHEADKPSGVRWWSMRRMPASGRHL